MAGQLLNRKREGEVEQNKQTPHKKEGKSKKKVDLLLLWPPATIFYPFRNILILDRLRDCCLNLSLNMMTFNHYDRTIKLSLYFQETKR